ncbi:hypothetical protein BD626DRAFT_185006 [Schizophyllum amplum]|uniref:Uncharacterized protein n=1 Tax=Schizophyllum amplum TaxID=97359 RepID=A0A550C0T3_9AGAR|nr:hypothetical protein BD626DRAFT_185006 [Auriculariopsis ampla]
MRSSLVVLETVRRACHCTPRLPLYAAFATVRRVCHGTPLPPLYAASATVRRFRHCMPRLPRQSPPRDQNCTSASSAPSLRTLRHPARPLKLATLRAHHRIPSSSRSAAVINAAGVEGVTGMILARRGPVKRQARCERAEVRAR